MQVDLAGELVTCDKKSVLGSGGEGTVFKVMYKGRQVALKIYEVPTRERSQKLMAFEKLNPNFPDRVIAPQVMARNGRGMVVGFTMPILTGTFEELSSLSSKKYRTSYGVTTRDVALTFLDGIPTLNSVHKLGFCVGDLNDRNELRGSNNRMLWIDVDSWQTGAFPCPVATETFLDPALYGIDLSVQPVFTPGNDWYSYAVMLFKSLLLVHPFGGTHKTVDGLMNRAAKRITVFDKGVIYPVIGISPDLLSDDLHNIFLEYFQKGIRNPFPERNLRDYLDSLTECKSCGTHYPSTRGNCPVCSAKTLVIIQAPKVTAKGIEVIEILRINGQILFTRVISEEVRALALESGKIVYYNKRPGLTQMRRELFDNIPGARFEMTADLLFVNPPGSNDLLAVNLADGKVFGKIPTEEFVPMRRAVFHATDEYLFRIAKGKLVYGRLTSGRLEEKILRQVMEDQTWFWVDPSSDDPSVFGFFQVLRQQMFWMYKNGSHFDVEIPDLEPTENVIDISAKFSSQGVYLIRKTKDMGKVWIRRDIIDSEGKVKFSSRMEESKHPNPSAHGQAYSTGVILHPTDAGVMLEEIASGSTKIFDATKGFVDSGDILFRYGSSLIVSKSDVVYQITLK